MEEQEGGADDMKVCDFGGGGGVAPPPSFFELLVLPLICSDPSRFLCSTEPSSINSPMSCDVLLAGERGFGLLGRE